MCSTFDVFCRAEPRSVAGVPLLTSVLVLYTFGPLHWYYFSPLKIPMFASIFAIVLFFAVVFRRSGNLWIVAVIHGIGNAYIVGSLPSTSKLSNRLQPPKPDDAIN